MRLRRLQSIIKLGIKVSRFVTIDMGRNYDVVLVKYYPISELHHLRCQVEKHDPFKKGKK